MALFYLELLLIRPQRGWVSWLGVEVVVKEEEGDAGGSCWSVWPSLSCLGLELAAACELALWLNRLIGGAWDVVFAVALECHHHRVAEPGPGPGRVNADELLGQSSLLGAVRGGCARRRLRGATGVNQTAVREREG